VNHYPLFLNLTGQPVVVIGAGKVATRKIRSLLTGKANVTVISPVATRSIQSLAQRDRLRWRRRRYRDGDLRGCRVVIVATDNTNLNERVCRQAQRAGLLVNCAAPPSAGNFIVPSVVRKNGITLAISTGGVSPALARQLRRQLEQFLGDEYAGLVRSLGKLRRDTPQAVANTRQRAALYRQAVRQGLRKIKKGKSST
jgi:precorrin-2 dehydrogenase/sirohydrochlorin ferrochelatase